MTRDDDELEEMRSRIVTLLKSDAVESRGPLWQKLEAAEVALDYALDDSDGLENLINHLEE